MRALFSGFQKDALLFHPHLYVYVWRDRNWDLFFFSSSFFLLFNYSWPHFPPPPQTLPFPTHPPHLPHSLPLTYFYFLESGKGGRKRGRETSMCGCLSHVPYWGPGYNPGVCPDWESNRQLFDSQASTQPLSHTSLGVSLFLIKTLIPSWGLHPQNLISA